MRATIYIGMGEKKLSLANDVRWHAKWEMECFAANNIYTWRVPALMCVVSVRICIGARCTAQRVQAHKIAILREH